MVARAIAALLLAGTAIFCAQPAPAQDAEEVKLVAVPDTLAQPVRDSLARQRAAIVKSMDDMNAVIDKFNARCGSFRLDDTATRSYCEGEQARLLPIIKKIETEKLIFNSAVQLAVARAARPKRSIDKIYVPSPVVAEEQASFTRNPAAWLAAAQKSVAAAVRNNKERVRGLLQAIDELSVPEPRYRLTKLSDLQPGDILLVAPADPRRDASGAALGAAIQGADYLTRVSSQLASRRVLQAARQQTAPVSHALAFVKDVNGTYLFLDHTLVGSRILDDRAFLMEYGAREMYVARPNDIVDGRALWNIASTAARQKKSDYGLFGGSVVCSERAGIAVARVTGTAPNRRLGPVDITPGDFFDTQGNTGKHFTVTRLYITPTHPEE